MNYPVANLLLSELFLEDALLAAEQLHRQFIIGRLQHADKVVFQVGIGGRLGLVQVVVRAAVDQIAREIGRHLSGAWIVLHSVLVKLAAVLLVGGVEVVLVIEHIVGQIDVGACGGCDRIFL